MKHSLSKLFYF